VSDIKAQVRDAAKRLADNVDDAGAAHELLDLLPRVGHERVQLVTAELWPRELAKFLIALGKYGGVILDKFSVGESNYLVWYTVPKSNVEAFLAEDGDEKFTFDEGAQPTFYFGGVHD